MDNKLVFTENDLIANDDGDNLTITALSEPSFGTVFMDGSRTITYAANTAMMDSGVGGGNDSGSGGSGYSGYDSFDYTISNNCGNESTAAVRVEMVNSVGVTIYPNTLGRDPSYYEVTERRGNEPFYVNFTADSNDGNKVWAIGDTILAVVLSDSGQDFQIGAGQPGWTFVRDQRAEYMAARIYTLTIDENTMARRVAGKGLMVMSGSTNANEGQVHWRYDYAFLLKKQNVSGGPFATIYSDNGPTFTRGTDGTGTINVFDTKFPKMIEPEECLFFTIGYDARTRLVRPDYDERPKGTFTRLPEYLGGSYFFHVRYTMAPSAQVCPQETYENVNFILNLMVGIRRPPLERPGSVTVSFAEILGDLAQAGVVIKTITSTTTQGTLTLKSDHVEYQLNQNFTSDTDKFECTIGIAGQDYEIPFVVYLYMNPAKHTIPLDNRYPNTSWF